MPDKLIIQNNKATVTTPEGQTVERDEGVLVDMFREELVPPLGNVALPDGVKFVEWRPPFLGVVHQMPAHVRCLRWIDEHSPMQFGPGTTYRTVRISVPYAITFAIYYAHGKSLAISGYNELYFKNEPIRSRDDKVCYPALLNISAIKTPTRVRSWICTQYLPGTPNSDWTTQLANLLDHTWNGGFNLSSEHHEGASWYSESRGVHKNLHPIEKWIKATEKDEAFALQVPWKPVSMNVGQLLEAMLSECGQTAHPLQSFGRGKKQPSSIVQRFLNFAQTRRKKKTA